MKGEMTNLKIIVLVALHVAVILGKPVTQETGSEENAMDIIAEINMKDNELAKNMLQIDVRETEEQIAIRQSSRKRRGAVRFSRLLWPGGIVYYNIKERGFTSEELGNIRAAMDHIQSNTCIQFKERNTGDYVDVFKGSGCWSFIGRIGGNQSLSLGRGCANSIATPTHEFIHAIGFFHEQARSDRGNFVNIHYENILPGREEQFEARGNYIDSLEVPYDTGSVMHYGRKTFTRNGNPTITSKRDFNEALGGNQMTESDVQQIKRLYGCPAEEPNVCESLNNIESQFYCHYYSFFGYCDRQTAPDSAVKCARQCCEINQSKK